MPFQLQSSETPELGIRRIIQDEMTGIIHQLEVQPDGGDRAVHQSRKSFKRIRAALRLVRGVLPKAVYREENLFFRDQSRLLSPVRDSAVLVETVEHLRMSFPEQPVEEPFAVLQHHLWERHERISAQFFQSGVMAGVASRLRTRLPALAALPVGTGEFDRFARGLRKVYRRGCRRMAAAYRSPYDPHTFHDWRKRVKYLWHQSEILTLLWPAYFTMWGDALHDLSDILGDAHDLLVLRHVLKSGPLPPEAQTTDFASLIDRRVGQLELMAKPLGQRLFHEKPRVIISRIGGYWVAHQDDPAELSALLAKHAVARPELLSTAEAAAHYGCTAAQVRAWIHRGVVPAVKVGGQWVLMAATLPENPV